jgi:hypothetical protein
MSGTKSIIDKIRDCEFEPWMFEPVKPMNEPETKSESPQLNEIAAIILGGLLASGDYTEGAEHFKPYGGERQSPRPRYRPEAVTDALELAREFIDKTSAKGPPNAS